ncbi:hypothetical protein MBLNU457_g0259t1 [Dothideomycetes sp. NU457]
MVDAASNDKASPIVRAAKAIWRRRPPVNFITLHYAYFIGTSLVTAIIFWGSSTPARSVSFTDSLYLTISAMTLAGLNPVNLSTLNTFQQIILFVLIMLGSAIFVSAFVVHVRRKAFEKKFDIVVEERKKRRSLMRRASFNTLPFVRSISRGRDPNGTVRGRPITEATSKQTNSTKPSPSAADDDTDESSMQRLNRRDSTPVRPINRSDTETATEKPAVTDDDKPEPENQPASPTFSPSKIKFGPGTNFQSVNQNQEDDGFPRRRTGTRRRSLVSLSGVGASSSSDLRTVIPRTLTIASVDDQNRAPRRTTHKYFPSAGFIGRNSQFHNLTEAEREELGGVEYKALYWLSWVVPIYFILWQLFSCIGLAAWVAVYRPDTALSNGLNPWWVGAFNAVSAFNNSGMSLLDANMTAFQDAYYMLITMSLLILAGNTCYPIFLRLIFWTILKLMPDHGHWKDHRNTITFLLDHPRRCYTNLFPARHTWWLLLAVITLNGIDWAAFEILNIGNEALYEVLPVNERVIDGLFQAFAVRNGGFYVVTITTLRISLQVLYVVMMYISIYPVVITMRNSNVYEERSLGVYADDSSESQEGDDKPKSFWSNLLGFKGPTVNVQETRAYFVQQQVRAQLAHDSWWLVLAIFLVMIIEGGQFERDPTVFSVFNVIFEIVSAYGTVGISTGVPWAAYSFSGAWHTLSKLILCAVMLRGRHRGLPVAIDKAVLLPGEKLGHAEEEDAMIRMERATSRARGDEAV